MKIESFKEFSDAMDSGQIPAEDVSITVRENRSISIGYMTVEFQYRYGPYSKEIGLSKHEFWKKFRSK